jgi:hypothetical protein
MLLTYWKEQLLIEFVTIVKHNTDFVLYIVYGKYLVKLVRMLVMRALNKDSVSDQQHMTHEYRE